MVMNFKAASGHKKKQADGLLCMFILVETKGIEPSTSRMRTERSPS